MSQPIRDQTCLLSVVLPAYNEGKKIQLHIPLLKAKLDSLGISYETIIVNDGSTDDTLSKAKPYESEHIRIFSYDQNKGKGFAVNFGMRQARGDYRIFMDADLSTSLDFIEPFLAVLKRDDVDMVIGTRKANISLQKRKQPAYRRFLGNLYTHISGVMIGRFLTDFTCGFKMYTRQSADIIFSRQRINNWAFDSELICIAAQHGLRIKEVPVIWSNDPDTKVRLWRDSITSFFALFMIRINAVLGRYR